MRTIAILVSLAAVALLVSACLPDLHWRSKAERDATSKVATQPPPTETPLPTETPVSLRLPTSEELRIDPSQLDEWAYSDCLDEIYLRADGHYESSYWLPAAVWHCRHLAPPPGQGSYPNRCILNRVRTVADRYPEWTELLTRWFAIAWCYPDATASQHGLPPDAETTNYGACLDNVYLTLWDRIEEERIGIGMTAWLCQRYLPVTTDPVPECSDTHMKGTEALFREWPAVMHEWHAVMHCLAEWTPSAATTVAVYETCLDEVYATVNRDHREAVAMSAAVWSCRTHMPPPPAVYHPRCEITHQQRAENTPSWNWPQQLRVWYSIVNCYPTPRLRMG